MKFKDLYNVFEDGTKFYVMDETEMLEEIGSAPFSAHVCEAEIIPNSVYVDAKK